MRSLISALAVLLQLSTSFGASGNVPVRIAISKGSNTVVKNYINWLKAAREDVEIIELSGLTAEQAPKALEGVDGLVLSGGADIDPVRYKRQDLRPLCESDVQRDEMEFALIARAQELQLPVLGICRGMQILNVAYGGTLIADIPTQYATTTEHRPDRELKTDAKHDVRFETSSYMYDNIKATEGAVNSAHHQCVQTLAPTFKAAAYATDGIIEALEWNEASRSTKPFLFAVQWHPERLKYDNPMSLNIAKRFLREVEEHKKKSN